MTLIMSRELDYRLAARRGQLETFFQPIVHLKDVRFKALEARVRWHIGTETLSARQVLASAASAADRFELDFLILETALAAYSSVPNDVLHGLQLAINLSPLTVLKAGFSERIETAIRNAGYTPERLHLEIPLEAFELDVERTRVQTKALAESGFTIAVDHLSDPNTIEALLDNIPISVVKLDEALISRLPADSHACETVSAIVAICRERGVMVGAEGVSRMDQLHCLQGLGCDEAQGMLICRPTPLNNLKQVLARRCCW